jgi:Integrase core domain.
MPSYNNNILSVTREELELIGVTAGYLKRALAGQRSGEVYCWEYHKVGKTIYVHYDSLKEIYKSRIRNMFCGGLEPEVWMRDSESRKAAKTLEAVSDQLTQLVTTDPDELDTLMKTQLYTPVEAHQLARAAGWLRLINEFDVKRARKLGYTSINELRNEIFKRCLNEQQPQIIEGIQKPALIRFKKGTIENERVLYRNAVDYKENGIESLIHRGVGNVNREKADTIVHAKLFELASNPVKHSFEDIAMIYNDWADLIQKPNMTVSAVKAYLNQPKVKRAWYYHRHGKLAADNEMQQLINREKPSFPDALWSIDGTATQLYYLADDGKTIKSDLYIYFIADACTGAIIGHSVAYTETSGMVVEAFGNAINTYGNRPYQIQYDNSSANQSGFVQNLMTNMARVHFACEPYKGRGKYVESIIGHFQQRVLRKRENFKGGNINVRRLNSQANPELLAELRKNKELLPTMDECISELRNAIQEWNERGERRDSFGRFVGQSKIDRYVNTAHEKRVQLNYFDKLSLFMVEMPQPYAYTTEGIRIELDKKKYHFRVPDGDGLGDFIFAAEHLGEKFTVRINRENPELILLFKNGIHVATAYETERFAACVADLKEGEKSRQMAFKAKQDEYGSAFAARELQRQMAILSDMKATGTDGFGWWDVSKLEDNARNNRAEDARNGMSDGLTELERKLMGIGK